MKRLLLLFVMVIITLVACSNDDNEDQDEQAERVTPVEVDEVTEGNLTAERHFYGRTMPNQTTPVIPSVAGEIDELEVTNGDKVEEDDTIATIASPQGKINVKASVDGTIAGLEAKEGSMVSNQDPLLTILDVEDLTVQLQIPAHQTKLFKKGKEVDLFIEDEEDKEKATVDYIAETANDAGLFVVQLSFENDNNYKAGAVASAVKKETIVKDTLIIPTQSLVEESDEAYVYVVEDETVKKVEVDVEKIQSSQTAIKADDLNEGDQIVTSGQLTLEDGGKINVIEED
ncbi:efflux RND transporter periplasmic adaptor subunit [Gracilibacillus sp. S3-1-1]|uniref:Efflux RND transporter periplasmic adaptor subunit n=1 Tax=Gracilibacillus pellucidus TaxID=3095368 RepID=A0ACC6M877_9BACI|nr:efflux RND transporter periplasmic adaptor subunit [Gracilibacillus sp. S3-1-1]MDX8047086.1 efflux RND transporter periplasmic adaptor subunit [Gracilibacillus sp. S3-1-1]